MIRSVPDPDAPRSVSGEVGDHFALHLKDLSRADAILLEHGRNPSRLLELRRVSSSLVERAQHGDHEAFDALATAAYHRLFAIARRILRDGYAAEDVVQDALVRAWRDLRGLREPDRFDAWLNRLLVRACGDHVRAGRRRPIEVPVLEIDRPISGDDMARVADRDELERAFLRLSIEHRAVLVLTHYVGMPATEVALVLGIPPGTVYSRLHYGLREMRAALTQSGKAGAPPSRPASLPEQGR